MRSKSIELIYSFTLFVFASCSTGEVAALADISEFVANTKHMVDTHRQVLTASTESLLLGKEILTLVRESAIASRAASEENRLAMVTVHEMAATLSALRAMITELTQAVAEMRVALKTR